MILKYFLNHGKSANCKLQIAKLINICKCQSIFIFLPYFQLAQNRKVWENKPMHCVNENISCSPQNRSWKMLHRFRTCYIVGWNPFWRRFLTFFSLYCCKIFINHYTMRRNLLNWWNKVSISKKLMFYVFGVVRIY